MGQWEFYAIRENALDSPSCGLLFQALDEVLLDSSSQW
jgi:hypothetical protein